MFSFASYVLYSAVVVVGGLRSSPLALLVYRYDTIDAKTGVSTPYRQLKGFSAVNSRGKQTETLCGAARYHLRRKEENVKDNSGGRMRPRYTRRRLSFFLFFFFWSASSQMPSADNFSSSTGNGRAVQVRRSRKFEGRRSTNGTIGNRLFLSVVWTERAVMVSALSSFIVAILCT